MLVIDNSHYQLPLDLSNKEVAVYIEDLGMIIRYHGTVVVATLNKALDIEKVNTIAPITDENSPQFGATVDNRISGSFEERPAHDSLALSGEFP